MPGGFPVRFVRPFRAGAAAECKEECMDRAQKAEAVADLKQTFQETQVVVVTAISA
jgi:acyl dehydratase